MRGRKKLHAVILLQENEEWIEYKQLKKLSDLFRCSSCLGALHVAFSSQVLVLSSIDVTQQHQQLALQPPGSPSQAISNKSVRYPQRPGMGKDGVRYIVNVNHFFAELPEHQYATATPSSFIILVFLGI